MSGAKLSLDLRLNQQLTMTPQLQQAIRLLQLPVLELNTQIEQALAENVMLEAEEPAEPMTEPEPAPNNNEEQTVIAGDGDESNLLWSDVSGAGARSDNWADDSRRLEIADTSDESLQEHLLWQLEMEHFSPREVVIGQTLIDAINEDGYLTESPEDIHRTLSSEAGFTLDETLKTLEKIQQLDPAGIGARDLAECVGIQLKQLEGSVPGRDAAIKIAQTHLDLVADQEYSTLRRHLGISEEELDAAIILLKACHPRPGSVIQSSTAEYIVPDVYVRKQDDKWIVEVNRSIAPQLKVNQTYAELLQNSEGHANLRTQLQEAAGSFAAWKSAMTPY